MEIFMSGEIDTTISEAFREIRNEIKQKLKILEVNDYGNAVQNLGIIPIIVNLEPELESAGFFKERKLYKKKTKDADYRLRIDYESFLNANYEKKKLLIIKNVVDCIRLLGKKVKKDFAAEQLENDVLCLFGIAKEEIDLL
ncbi:Imm44 family immunity protein [Desulfosporosinus lacus]|uniref:Immunity protein 44 n=1 Tax=Desulfosporosinus lacus DSM 15449 TaxID=1121420 RepID=A0A1M5Z077_9FIRM|nr:Imm44 family immunity protein [Desulfosporosinus lacus]SHI17478.1 Immunity protein 44 [Desulfosporosinus lacus DSM 15449]